MAEPTLTEIALRDPLGDVTRKERRLLMGISMIGIALVKTGLLPEKISTLGIEFSQTNQKSLLVVFSFVTIYFLVAFTIYAAADFIAWRSVFYAALREARSKEQEQRNLTDPNDAILGKPLDCIDRHFEQQMLRGRFLLLFKQPVMFIRAIFEFILPIVVGLCAIVLLWRYE